MIIFSVSYRPVTEVPWYTVFADAEYAMKWLANNASDMGGDLSLGFLVGGVEAGAHLAAITAIRTQDKYPQIHLMG